MATASATASAPRLVDDTLAEHWVRQLKTNVLRAARLAAWMAEPAQFPAPVLAPIAPMRLEVRIDGDTLVVRGRSRDPLPAYELVALDERVEQTAEGPVRCSRIARRRAGTKDASEEIAVNRRRVLTTHEQRRSCLTCGETTCPFRTIPQGGAR